MRHTSSKTGIAAMAFFLFGFFALFMAEALNRATNKIIFAHASPQWNYWNYIAAGSFILFVALLVVSLTFLQKDD